jgi:hypothetical protein
MAKRGRPRKSKIYFTSENEEAIIKYNKSNDSIEKEMLFTKLIYPAFYKIAENVYNKYKITWINGSFRDIMNDCIVFMFERLHMYKGERGKAFSYYTIIARNYFWYTSTQSYKEVTTNVDFETFWVEAEDAALEMEYDSERFDRVDNFVAKIIPYMKENMQYMMGNEEQIEIGYLALEYFSGDVVELTRKEIQKDIATKAGILHYGNDKCKMVITKALNRLKIYYYNAKSYYNLYGKMPEFVKFDKLSRSDIKFILDNYDGNSKEFGCLGLARKLKIEENKIRAVVTRPYLFT